MCMMLVCSITPTVSASENQARGIACPKCTSGSLVPIKSYGSWYNTGTQRDCVHLAYGTDVQQARKITTTNKCNSCSYGFTSSSTETRWACRGSAN